MLVKETVEKGKLDLVDKLMADDKLASFNLVGRTAPALKSFCFSRCQMAWFKFLTQLQIIISVQCCMLKKPGLLNMFLCRSV